MAVSVDALAGPTSLPQRALWRVVANVALGKIASTSAPFFADPLPPPQPVLGLPYPNPARERTRFALSTPPGAPARVRLYDVRGRRLAGWDLQGGVQWLEWDGSDGEGRPLPAGVYLFSVEAAGRSGARKVVWLR
jgi:hypothetical protein